MTVRAGSMPVNADGVMDARAPLGIHHINLPLTLHRVVQAMREAEGASGG
jgi:hypothetical protein